MNFDVIFCNSYSGKMIKVTFWVLQGSVATQLRCGVKHDKHFIANLLLNPKVEKFWKSAKHLVKFWTENIVIFFSTHSVYERAICLQEAFEHRYVKQSLYRSVIDSHNENSKNWNCEFSYRAYRHNADVLRN